jgi:succinyl-CoA synthetase beta subunit
VAKNPLNGNKGLPVRKVLIDEASIIDHEIYLGITNDRTVRKPVIMASAAGGVDIEEVARTTPEKSLKSHRPLLGLKDYQARNIAIGIDLPKVHWRSFEPSPMAYGRLISKVMLHWRN